MKKIEILTSKKNVERVEKITGQKTGIIYEDKYVKLVKDAVRFPNGSFGTYIRFMEPEESRYGCVILPIIKETNEIILLNHWRHAVQDFCIEAPRGFGTASLDFEDNARNELQEEMNVSFDDIMCLGSIYPDTGLFEKKVYVFAALISESEASALKCNDEREIIDEYYRYSKDDIAELISENRLKDAYTLTAISMATFKGIF